MPVLQARTRDEAHLYMSLVACRCGNSEFEPETDVLSLRPRVLSFSAACPQCGRSREFVFELPDPPAASAPGADDGDGGEQPFGAGPEPSTLVDAGQWLVLSELLSENVRELTARPLAPEEIAAGYDLVRMAAAAVDEVLKFVPPGSDAVPDDVFWTDQGLAVQDAQPALFRRDRLLGLRRQRWEAVTEFEDAYDVDAEEDDDDLVD